ncbi:MAG: beta-galactosidase [Lachnospiraceae bacterium]|nr:beta-galactosidase [Lachnospiraceae bacterium]
MERKMVYQFQEYKKSEILRDHLKMGRSNNGKEEIKVNSLYFERNGKPWIGVMGEVHFSRLSREDWYEELCKMKAGGVTVAATYLFWIYHEEIEGEFDFSGDKDIRAFILEAQRAGVDVVIRIGPWAHGECRNGGFPDWLMKKDFKLRDNNPGYMEKARIWYEKIYEQVQGLFFKDGGNIVGIQFENELVDNAEHLLALKEMALEMGYEAPIYTVTGWNSEVGARIPVDDVVPVFAAYVDMPWAEHTNQLPPCAHYVFDTRRNDSTVGTDIIQDTTSDDGWRIPYEKYPFATCELGSGLQSTHHRRINVSGMDAYALSLMKLGDGNNLVGYYMYHGGTNKIGKLSTLQESKATGYPNDLPVLNYDFHTALTQYGEAREQYGMMNMLHLFVADFGDVFAPMENVMSTYEPVASDFDSLRYCMRTDGESGFVFVNHYQRLGKLTDHEDVVLDTGKVVFPAFDVKGEICFFFPFNMDISGMRLEYASAQPLCKAGDTYFFVAVEGITPQYKFADKEAITVTPGKDSMVEAEGVKIVTLTFAEARYLRKLSGRVYLGENCDLYEADGEIKAIQNGDFTYHIWTGKGFERVDVTREFHPAQVTFEAVSEVFTPTYLEELNFGSERKRTWKKVTVSTGEGFIEIPDVCDVEQIYADGEMVADKFYDGENWRVPAKLLYGKECYLVMSELKDDIYREF